MSLASSSRSFLTKRLAEKNRNPKKREISDDDMMKKYKITTCASTTAIGGTICSDIVGYSASKGIGGVTGGN